MKHLFLYISFIFCTISYGQFDGINVGSVFHNINSNPGITGNKNDLIATLSFRNDWLGDDKHPRSFILSAHTPLKKKYWSIGLVAFNDRFGKIQQNGLLGLTSYKVPIKNGNLSFGVKTGVFQYNENNQTYATIIANDPAFANLSNIYSISLGLGLYYETKKYYLGVSIPETSNRTSSKLIPITNTDYWTKTVLAGLNHNLNEKINVSTHILLRKLGHIKSQIQWIPMISYNETLDFGVIFRSNNSYGLIGSYKIHKQFRLSYSFDYNNSIIAPQSIGNHEIILGYSLAKIVNTFNPKFF